MDLYEPRRIENPFSKTIVERRRVSWRRRRRRHAACIRENGIARNASSARCDHVNRERERERSERARRISVCKHNGRNNVERESRYLSEEFAFVFIGIAATTSGKRGCIGWTRSEDCAARRFHVRVVALIRVKKERRSVSKERNSRNTTRRAAPRWLRGRVKPTTANQRSPFRSLPTSVRDNPGAIQACVIAINST